MYNKILVAMSAGILCFMGCGLIGGHGLISKAEGKSFKDVFQRVAYGSPGFKLGLIPGNIPIRIGSEEIFIGGDIVLEVQGMPISLNTKETCEIRDTVGGLKQGERIVFNV